MSGTRSDGGSPAGPLGANLGIEELRRRNPNAVAVDALFLLTTAFFAHLSLEGLWPAVIAAVPFAALLYFGWKSSRAFFLAQLAAIAATAVATYADLGPL